MVYSIRIQLYTIESSRDKLSRLPRGRPWPPVLSFTDREVTANNGDRH